jgi:C-terminal processing protease CtpA/Prc
MRCTFLFVVALTATVLGQSPPPATVETSERDSVIDALATKLSAGYVLPDAVGRITQALRSASRGREYDGKAAKEFAEAINRTLLNASHDKHLSVNYQPAPTVSPDAATPSVEPRERLNFGFGKLERLRGNVGYLELLSFSDLRQQSAETASALLSTLANFDAIILDLRRNSGGNTPMVAFVATYFFETARVHLTDIYWRDTNETNQFWTTTFVPGRRAARQPLYILTSTSTFSAAEDFCYSLQNLKRAIVVGETTGGGAHSSRGPQRLTQSFTAIIPAGRSISPITKTNWEGTGITPDIKTSADASLGVAHLHALRSLLARETDRQWKQTLQQVADDLSKSVSASAPRR